MDQKMSYLDGLILIISMKIKMNAIIYIINDIGKEEETELEDNDINPLNSTWDGVYLITSPYLSEGAPATGELKGLILSLLLIITKNILTSLILQLYKL